MITVNCSCIINLMYEVIKLAMCGSHGFSSDVCINTWGLVSLLFDDLWPFLSPYIFNGFEFFIMSLSQAEVQVAAILLIVLTHWWFD